MHVSLTSWIGLGAMAAVCSFATIRGRWPERVAALSLAAAWIGSEVLEDWRRLHTAQPAIFAIDVGYFAVLLYLVLNTHRLWVIPACAFDLLIVVTHLIMFVDPSLTRWDFFSAYFVWSYLVVIALGAGALFEGRFPVNTSLWGRLTTRLFAGASTR